MTSSTNFLYCLLRDFISIPMTFSLPFLLITKRGKGNVIFLNPSKFHFLRKILSLVTHSLALLVFCLNCFAVYIFGKLMSIPPCDDFLSPLSHASSSCGLGIRKVPVNSQSRTTDRGRLPYLGVRRWPRNFSKYKKRACCKILCYRRLTNRLIKLETVSELKYEDTETL